MTRLLAEFQAGWRLADEHHARDWSPPTASALLRFDSKNRALLATAWSSGMRWSELARMTIEDLDLDNGVVVIPQAKNGHPRVAPLSLEAEVSPRRSPRTPRVGR